MAIVIQQSWYVFSEHCVCDLLAHLANSSRAGLEFFCGRSFIAWEGSTTKLIAMVQERMPATLARTYLAIVFSSWIISGPFARMGKLVLVPKVFLLTRRPSGASCGFWWAAMKRRLPNCRPMVCVFRTGQPFSDSCSVHPCDGNFVLPGNAHRVISCASRHHSSDEQNSDVGRKRVRWKT
jgi:hypothetical protein